ncbi:MAG: septum site-determining protein MinC [Firmicutes bacterium]|nr:septum site-determining protein MinC [Bacillota bacterium]
MVREEAVFKGTRDGLLIILDDHSEFKQVLDMLKAKLEAARGFFQGAQVIIDSGNRKLTGKQKKTLSKLINSQTGLTLKGFSDDKIAETAITKEKPETKPKEAEEQNLFQVSFGQVSPLPVMFINRNLRCGQRVKFAGHVVVTGDVNPGAEIVAHGNVVVIGTLRGLVHAGVSGDQKAFVAAFRLEPSQLRIAGVFTRSPDEDAKCLNGRPEIARLRDGNIVVEQSSTNQTLSLVQRG